MDINSWISIGLACLYVSLAVLGVQFLILGINEGFKFLKRLPKKLLQIVYNKMKGWFLDR